MTPAGTPPVAPRRPALRAARWATLVVGAVLAGAGWLVAGGPGAVSVLVGLVIVVAFFASGMLPLLVADAAPVRAGAGLALLLLTYTLRLALALAALRLASRAEALDERWLGASILGCAAAWCTGLFLGWVRGDRASTIAPP